MANIFFGTDGRIKSTFTRKSPQDKIDALLSGSPIVPTLSQVAGQDEQAGGAGQNIPNKIAPQKNPPNNATAPLGQTPNYRSSIPVSYQAYLRDSENAEFFKRARKTFARPVGNDRRSERAKESSLGSGDRRFFEKERNKAFGAGMGGARPASKASARKMANRGGGGKAPLSGAAQQSARETRQFFGD